MSETDLVMLYKKMKVRLRLGNSLPLNRLQNLIAVISALSKDDRR